MQTVNFIWREPAQYVLLTGSFSDWQPLAMTFDPPTRHFRASVPLVLGRAYHYKFIVDGVWRFDPSKPQETDRQGNTNNIIHLESLGGVVHNPESGARGAGGISGGPVCAQNQPKPLQALEKTRLSFFAPPQNRGQSEHKGMIEVEPTSGTRDFYPELMIYRNWLFGHFRSVAKSFAFLEYDTPILESEELYKRKAGEEITAQMYNFKDKDGYNLALRPEMTPSLARLFLRAGNKLVLPLKWFSIPQCWRFEVTRVGRFREHFQWNMDILGVESITAEVELIAAIVTVFKRVGLTSKDVGIKINSRQILQQVLTPLGITSAKFAPVCVIIDKMDKLSKEEVTKQLQELEISDSVVNVILDTLSTKSLVSLKEKLPPNSPVLKDLDRVWEIARAYEFDDWLVFDASVVRGLAYYTGIVFECFDREGEFRAIAGGGRYDKLLTLYGSTTDVPACGFGFGDCVIMELLYHKNLLPVLKPEIDDIIIAFNESLREDACRVASKLRSQGRLVDVLLVKKKIHQAFDFANKIGASRAILIAPDEWSKGLVRIKDLNAPQESQTKEINVPFADL